MGTDIELAVEWSLGLLRLTVRDNSPDLPRQHYPPFVDVHGRGLGVVAALSRAFGVLPTADAGKAVWAVLNAARPKLPTLSEMYRVTPVLERQLGHDHPQIPPGLSTYSRALPTPRDGLSQNVAVTSDQR